MEHAITHLTELADKNPCIKFIIDNYDMLCCTHFGKVVMTMNSNELFRDLTKSPGAYVAKVFDSELEAMSYTSAMDMGHVPYGLIECNGGDISKNLLWSIGCKE